MKRWRREGEGGKVNGTINRLCFYRNGSETVTVDNLLSCSHRIAVFVYSMPGYKCPIKERMLYSTCKGPLLDVATGSDVGLEIGRKV